MTIFNARYTPKREIKKLVRETPGLSWALNIKGV